MDNKPVQPTDNGNNKNEKKELQPIKNKPAVKPESVKNQPVQSQTASASKENEKEEKKRLTKKQVAFILGIVLIVCATAVAIVYMILNNKPIVEENVPVLPISGTTYLVTPENVSDIDQEIKDKVAKGMFTTYMNTTWRFPDGKSASSNAIMGNSTANNYGFYFTVTISDTNETVFTSGLIPVGTQIAEIKLEKELAKGTYDAVISVQMLEEDGTPVDSNMGFAVTIVIEK